MRAGRQVDHGEIANAADEQVFLLGAGQQARGRVKKIRTQASPRRYSRRPLVVVMTSGVPVIHTKATSKKDVDGRDKRGHDVSGDLDRSVPTPALMANAVEEGMEVTNLRALSFLICPAHITIQMNDHAKPDPFHPT